ncbi:hypothetical protein PEC301296_10410 [Pectobacterium carotovorum subsp. carotovorum]|nr:hypothetical protein GZ59_15560 [Pectobacterium atrosepticum]POW26146.1 hypothetical protein PB72LOC_03313 [Pectobacterium atrosepticum]GKV84729.1 hypothetical protein PEC301296_10410 [Pectobacterium carotovorum subsp. carotovorum]
MTGMLLFHHDQIKQIIGTINHIYAELSTKNGKRRGTRNRNEVERETSAQSEKTLAGHQVRKVRNYSDLVINHRFIVIRKDLVLNIIQRQLCITQLNKFPGIVTL